MARHLILVPLISVYKGKHLLFDIEKDPWERDDIAAENLAILNRLKGQYESWNAGTVQPKWLDPHGANIRKEEAKRQATVEAASRGEKK